MAVYKRSYHGYSGPLTPPWSRFLILTRSASAELRKSRAFTGFFVLCLFPFLITAVLIYLNHNTMLMTSLRLPRAGLLEINGQFFRVFLEVQMSLAFLLTAFAGPGLISPDLSNNALVLYFCRPLSRTEYVLGKLMVLARLLSYITWIPGLALFLIEGSQSGVGWMWTNLYIAGALLAGSFILIGALSLLALALSAWVKWRPVAGALVLGVLFIGAGFRHAINAVMRTENGYLIDIGALLSAVLDGLFRVPAKAGVSPAAAWIALLSIAGVCLWMLSRKLRAYEVVR